MFHLLYALSKSIGSAIARQQVQLQNSTKAYKRNSKRSHLLPPSLRCQPKSQYYKPNRTNWKSTVKTISKIYTPVPNYSYLTSTPGISIWVQLPTRLQSILANVERLGQTYAPTRAAAAIDVWQRQIPHLSGTIHAWWQWVLKLSVPKPKTRIHNIGCSQFSCLGSGINKPKDTRHELKQGYHQATQQAHARFLAHSFTHTETLAQQQWIDWAIWMCAKFQHFLCCRRTQWLFISSPSFSSGLHGTNLEGVDSHS